MQGHKTIMSGPDLWTVPSGEMHILAKYALFLEDPSVKRKNFEGKTFYHPDKVRSWISSNAEKILSAVFPTAFAPVEANQITSLPLVLAILAHPSIRCAEMIDAFKQHIKDDNNLFLSNMTAIYAAVIEHLENYHHRPVPNRFEHTGYKGVTEEFDKLRWSFCVVSLEFNMNESHGELSVLPFCYADVINTKGGTANVRHIKIQTDLVKCERLREKLQPSQHMDNEFGQVSCIYL